jgi:CBS domain containing-hemolysin-like protein
MDDIEEELGLVLEATTEVDTLGGYVHLKLGRMPYVGDVVHTDESTIEVISILGNRLRKLKINIKSDAVAMEDGAEAI